MMDWSTAVDSVLSRGSYYTLYDIRNNQTIRVKYTTGSSHMDIEPATAEDTAKLLVDTFLATEHEGGRHARRVALIDSLPME